MPVCYLSSGTGDGIGGTLCQGGPHFLTEADTAPITNKPRHPQSDSPQSNLTPSSNPMKYPMILRHPASFLCCLGLGFALLALAPAKSGAAVYILFTESAGNVVTTGSGTINLDGLNYIGPAFGVSATIEPVSGVVRVGYPLGNDYEVYGYGSPVSPMGSGGNIYPDSGSGDSFGVSGVSGLVVVPYEYVSNTPLSGTSTWNNKTFSSLGLTPGTYTYSWGSGATADSVTVQIGPVVPEPGSAALAGLADIGLMRRRRK